ncbi:hypothetical protein KIN20_009719 [Parelaphostrongylus tenuis]|uniref:ATPase dynein-related AAA domain-containing protein n=1 Tax=Parelaphostrongylus tenuis TaxID=148309 RepID=A0AAD5MPF1_PARTN|nr:hypothetical protein KIN20_009719 [Parelaphostrongylus tenuis]
MVTSLVAVFPESVNAPKSTLRIRSVRVTVSEPCAVRAALNGRVLVIDGVEKAERNVLPNLNNLLENRYTAVESIAKQTNVENGVLKYVDCALGWAARTEHVLVINDADKAPLQ